MRKYITSIVYIFLFSTQAWSQPEKEGYVRPTPSKEVKVMIREGRKLYTENLQQGITKMKDVVSYCKEKEENSNDHFYSTFDLGVLYFRSAYMDSSLYTFRNGLEVAKKRNDHYFYYKSYLGFARVFSYRGIYDSANFYARKGLSHSKAIDYKVGISNLYNFMGVLAGHSGAIDSATYYKKKSLEIAEKQKDTLGIFTSAYNLAVHFQVGKQYKKSLEYSIYAQEVAKSTGQNYQRGQAFSVLSQVYRNLGDYKKSLSYNQNAIEANLVAIELGEHESHMQWVAFSYLNRGGLYNLVDSTAKARQFLKKAMLYFDSTAKLESRASAYAQYASSFKNEGRYDSALHYALIAKKLGDESNHILEIMSGNMILGSTYYALLKKDSAKYHAKIVLKLAEESGNLDYVEDASSILYQVYDDQNKPEKALTYLKKLTAAKDTLENEERVKATTRLSMQFEFDNEKQTLQFAKEKETLVLNQQIQKQKTIQYGAFLGMLLFLLATLGFYRSYRNKKRDHLKIEKQANELKKSNDQLDELSRYKEGLSHMIVHDMKNPLNVILGMTDEKLPNEEDTRSIHASGKMILQLANNIMDIQKFEEAKMHLKNDAYYLHEIIHHAKQQVLLLLKNKNIQFETEFSQDLTVSVDLEIISRVFVNLFTNAIKYSPAGGRVIIKVKENNNGFFAVSVTDHGQGIAASQLPYVFDKFWQVYAKDSGQTYSTGLGLTYCKLALEAHGGSIQVISSIGNGTTFTLLIPVFEKEGGIELVNSLSYANKAIIENSYTKEDLYILGSVMEKIKSIPLYKAGEIEKILNQVSSDSQKISEWIYVVKQAVLNWDQQHFDQLVSLDNQTPSSGTT